MRCCIVITVLVRTILMYGIILISMKIMGKRQLGQMQISEFITAMILSELASLPISDKSIPLIYSLVPLILIISIEVILSFISLKSFSAQKLLESTPTYIMDKGVLNQDALVNTRITINELLVELRIAGFTSLSEIEYIYLEPNGKFSFVPKAQYRQATVEDLSLNASESDPDISIIIDTKVIENGLKYLGKNENWMKKAISPHTADDILLFACNRSGKKTIITKENKK